MQLFVVRVNRAVVDKKPQNLKFLYYDVVAGLRPADKRVQNWSLNFIVVQLGLENSLK